MSLSRWSITKSRKDRSGPWETVEILEWAALLWILALAKARSAAPISAAISAKRATKASAKINATLEGARQKGSLAASLVRYSPCGDAPHSLLAIRPSASTRDPLQYFNSLLSQLRWVMPERLADSCGQTVCGGAGQ